LIAEKAIAMNAAKRKNARMREERALAMNAAKRKNARMREERADDRQ